MNDGYFSQESLESTITRVYNKLTLSKNTELLPQAFILGGQPGAGKTGLQEIMAYKCNHNLIVINGDEFRELHPDFDRLQEKYGKDSVDYTGAFSGKVTEGLIDKLKQVKYNVLVEGTLRTAETPLKTCCDFKNSGYNVTLAIIAVKPEISYLSTVFRYENMVSVGKTPRATPKKNHDLVVERIPQNVRELFESKQFDNILIYNREGECLYDMSRDRAVTPDAVMEKALHGTWTQQELDQFVEIGQATMQLLCRKPYYSDI